MVNREKQIAQFIDAINKNAIKECKRIEKATKKLYTGEAEKLQKSVEVQIQERIAYAKAELETEFNKNVATSYSNCRAKTAQRRTELTEKVFEKAKAKLIDFTNSDEYLDFLAKSLKEIYEYVGEKLEVCVKPEDTDKVIKAAEKCGVPCEIKADMTIKLGGVKVESEKMLKIFDDTLDSRLEDQREWFFANSNFKISE